MFCVNVTDLVLYCQLLIAFAFQEQPEVGSKERLLKKWKGQKLVRDSDWDRLKSSLCLIEWEDPEYSYTATGFIGKKGGKLYLVTCWHNFEGANDRTELVEDILEVAKKCTFRFSYIDETDQQKWCLEGNTLLQDKNPVGTKVCTT